MQIAPHIVSIYSTSYLILDDFQRGPFYDGDTFWHLLLQPRGDIRRRLLPRLSPRCWDQAAFCSSPPSSSSHVWQGFACHCQCQGEPPPWPSLWPPSTSLEHPMSMCGLGRRSRLCNECSFSATDALPVTFHSLEMCLHNMCAVPVKTNIVLPKMLESLELLQRLVGRNFPLPLLATSLRMYR